MNNSVDEVLHRTAINEDIAANEESFFSCLRF